MLHNGTADCDATRAGATHCQMCGRRVSLLDKVLSSSNHVVDGVLLGFLPPCIVPGFAELSAASRVHDGPHSPSFNPSQNAGREGWIIRNSVSAVAVVKGWMRAIHY